MESNMIQQYFERKIEGFKSQDKSQRETSMNNNP